MSSDDTDPEPLADPAAAPRKEAPYEALFPNLDKVSSSTFEKGTLSRRRVMIALGILAAVAIAIVVLIVVSGALFGPS
ncbi:hypothetical protein C5E11_01975 [Clavibacter michiganensis]|nr:hypothetical protein [Clavibacter michiganensis]PPF64866.1 hypothetical protein C5E11_01975 [Clavibacter michiganensis]